MDAELSGDPLPVDFRIGVIFGRSGSGKSTIMRRVRKMIEARVSLGREMRKANELGMQPQSEEPPNSTNPNTHTHQAVCSLFRDENGKFDGLERMSSVGLNKIPSWLRPFHVLSNGEQSRALLALNLRSDSNIDDFAAVVDDTTACAMAHSLQRTIRSSSKERVLIATTNVCAVRYLQPEFVIFTSTCCIVDRALLGNSIAAQKLNISFSTPGMESFSDRKSWFGETDDCADALDANALFGLNGRQLFPVTGTDPAVSEKVLRMKVKCDNATAEVAGAFEFAFSGESQEKVFVPNKHPIFSSGLPNITIGAIVGPSGTGKSTALKCEEFDALQESIQWEHGQSVVSHFAPEDTLSLEGVFLLPRECYLRSISTLSSSEQHRANIARLLLKHCSGDSAHVPATVVIDEFTSFMDRSLAKSFSEALQGFLRADTFIKSSHIRRLVVAGVHSDILRWLSPDWVLHSKTGAVSQPRAVNIASADEELSSTPFESASSPLPPPVDALVGLSTSDKRVLLPPPDMRFKILSLAPPDAATMWENYFADHHYFSKSLPNPGQSFIVRRCNGDEMPAAFIQAALLPGAYNGGITYRESRIVVLPPFQGFGIGPRLSNLVAQKYLDQGLRYFAHTAHVRLGKYRMSMPQLWKPVSGNLKSTRNTCLGYNKRSKAQTRRIYRHQFLGTQGDGNNSLRKIVDMSCSGSWAFTTAERRRIKRDAVLCKHDITRNILNAVKKLRPTKPKSEIALKTTQLAYEIKASLLKGIDVDTINWETEVALKTANLESSAKRKTETGPPITVEMVFAQLGVVVGTVVPVYGASPLSSDDLRRLILLSHPWLRRAELEGKIESRNSERGGSNHVRWEWLPGADLEPIHDLLSCRWSLGGNERKTIREALARSSSPVLHELPAKSSANGSSSPSHEVPRKIINLLDDPSPICKVAHPRPCGANEPSCGSAFVYERKIIDLADTSSLASEDSSAEMDPLGASPVRKIIDLDFTSCMSDVSFSSFKTELSSLDDDRSPKFFEPGTKRCAPIAGDAPGLDCDESSAKRMKKSNSRISVPTPL